MLDPLLDCRSDAIVLPLRRSTCQENFDIARDSRKWLTMRPWGKCRANTVTGKGAATADDRADVQPARHRSPLAAITRGEQVYTQLRTDILSGRVLPGTRLRFAELTDRYDCSTSVLREGLTRLAEQGLVQSEPQHGFCVTPLSDDDLDDLTTARCELEGLVLRKSIENGDIAWESDLVAAHHALDRTPMETDGDPVVMSEEWTMAHFALPRGTARRLPQSTTAHDGTVPA